MFLNNDLKEMQKERDIPLQGMRNENILLNLSKSKN